jgi:hypothetical protein
MRAMGEKAAITPLTESVEHVGWCRKTAMVFVICLEYTFYLQIKKTAGWPVATPEIEINPT